MGRWQLKLCRKQQKRNQLVLSSIEKCSVVLKDIESYSHMCHYHIMPFICFSHPFSMHPSKQIFKYDLQMSIYTITESIQETFWCYLTRLIKTSMKKGFIAAHYQFCSYNGRYFFIFSSQQSIHEYSQELHWAIFRKGTHISCSLEPIPPGIYLSKVKDRNTRTMYEICDTLFWYFYS